jgi:hypothetical protein
MNKEQEEQGFRITDKRGFKEDGEVRTPESTEKSEEKPAGEQTSADKNASAQDQPPRPPVTFTSYVVGYYTQSMVFLGAVPNPYTNKKEEDLEAARQLIDILSMMEEKTKGNLTTEEQKLLEDVLYDLRMTFMAKTDRIKL